MHHYRAIYGDYAGVIIGIRSPTLPQVPVISMQFVVLLCLDPTQGPLAVQLDKPRCDSRLTLNAPKGGWGSYRVPGLGV